MNTGPRKKVTPAKETAQVSAVVGKSGAVFVSGDVKSAPDSALPLGVQYTNVPTDYRKAVENALARESIPPAYKARVREYFGALAK
ncbi:MAG: hypothetical protein QHI38_07970 [Armatimonadota bacterium]|nr:hypothetical protein [Armatimonadota bacterium]